jgi:hypothetical protein
MSIVIFCSFFCATNLAQCMAYCTSLFVGGWAKLMPYHLYLNAYPWDPNIWSLKLGELYEVIFVGHVIGEEKYEC